MFLVLLIIAIAPNAWIGVVHYATVQQDYRREVRVRPQINKQLPDQLKRFALIIGVDEYQDRQINGLTGATNDAKAIANAIVEYGGFLQEQVVLLASDQPYERRPTRGNILRRLSNLSGIVPKDGMLVISFAGHGIERNGHVYILTEDSQLSDDIKLLEETAISADVIKSWIREAGVGQVVIILDACRNNPISDRGNANIPLTDTYARSFQLGPESREVKAFATLYGTEVGGVAYEYKEKKQGYFTWALVEGLKGAAANENGYVTLARLIKYIQEAVPKRISIDLGPGMTQRPFAVVEGYKADELILTRTQRGDLSANSNQDGDNTPSKTSYPAPPRNNKPNIGNVDIISGAWDCRYGPGAFPFALSLRLNGHRVTGVYTIYNKTSTIDYGEWDGRNLTLRIIHEKDVIRMTAVIKQSEFSGNIYLNGSNNPQTWNGKRSLNVK